MGKKSSGTQYDPQIGAAAQATSQASLAAEQFGENFQTNEITPLLHQMISASQQSQSEDQALFGINMQQTQDQLARYKQYGIPAENNYYGMVNRFSAPEEQDREAQAALGDMRNAEAGQGVSFSQGLQARGINPNSGAVVSGMADMAVGNSANEAAAMNRARNSARTMGISLTQDAANFGRGGQSSVLNFGAAAGGNAGSSFGAASGALAGANGSYGAPMAGYNTAIQGYGSNMSNYTKLGVQDMQTQAQADAGLGNFLGSALGFGMRTFTPSDRSVKRNITKVGHLPSGIGVYDYRYIWDDEWHRGVLADEVEQVIPLAVMVTALGFKAVDYSLVR